MGQMDLLQRNPFLKQTEACIERNELRSALNLAEARLKRSPGDLDARIVICRVWLLQGRLTEARDLLCEMEEILASLSQIYACIGDICMKKGQRESAETFYRKFLSLNPGVPLSQGGMERMNGIAESLETDAQEGTDTEVEIPAGFQTVTLAELYIRQGHLRQAEELLETIIGQDPQNGKASLLLRELRGQPAEQHTGVVAELSRWLENIGRLRAHAV